MTLTRSVVETVDRGSLRTRLLGESAEGVFNFASLKPRAEEYDVIDIGVFGLYHMKHVSQS